MRTILRHRIWGLMALMLLSGTVRGTNDTIRQSYKLCPDESIVINDSTYSDPGIYYQTYYQTDTTGTDTTLYIITISQYDRVEHIYNESFDATTEFIWYYTVNGQMRSERFTQPGTYDRYFANNQTGCKELYRLVLTLKDAPAPSNVYTTNASTCAGEIYSWRGKGYQANGQYRDSVPHGSAKPDSIFVLNLTVWPSIDTTVTRLYECGGGPITYKGQTYTRDTIIVRHEYSVHGCDSIIKAILSFNTSSFSTDTVSIKKSEFPFEWHDQTITKPGTYTYRELKEGGCYDRYELVVYQEPVHTTIDLEGCLPEGVRFRDIVYYEDTTFVFQLFNDTLYTVNIHVCEQGQSFQTDTIICEENLPYLLGEFTPDTIWAEGYYLHKEKIDCGCFKTWELNLHIRPSFKRATDSLIVCERDIKIAPVILGDTSKFDGHYRGIIISRDSVVTDCNGNTFHVIVRPTDDREFRRTIYTGDSIRWNNRWEFYSGIYDSTFYASGIEDGQCLSTHRLYLSVINRIQVTIQENEQYRFGHNPDGSERYVNQNGYYYDTIHNATTGCDSIVALELFVLPNTNIRINLNESICQGDYYEFFGQTLTGKGIYTHTSNDTVYSLTLTVHPVSLTKEYVLLAPEQMPYPHNGYFCDTAGIYIDTLRNQYMCDSIVHMTLVVTDKLSAWDNIPLCSGESIVVDGQTITKSGEYTFPHRSASGDLDSLYRVVIYDAPAFDLPLIRTTLYDGDTLRLADTVITTAGHYDIYRKTVHGCDSIVHADVNTHSILHDTICAGEEYAWRDSVYTQSGEYSDTIRAVTGNYMSIYTLVLKAVGTMHLDTVYAPSVSADNKQFSIELSYSGDQPVSYSLSFDKAALRAGFSDVRNQEMTTNNRIDVAIPQFTDTCYLDHTQYVRPDRYTMQLTFDNGRCGTFTTDTFSVLVKYPSWIIEQNWNNVVAPLKPEYNGGFRFSRIQWYVNDEIIEPVSGEGLYPTDDNLRYLYHPTLIAGDEVYMMATREGEIYAIPTEPIKITIAPVSDTAKPVIVFPSAVSHLMPAVTIEAAQSGSYEVYNTTGLLLFRGEMTDGQTQVQLPAVSGIYFIRTRQSSVTQTHTIILY